MLGAATAAVAVAARTPSTVHETSRAKPPSRMRPTRSTRTSTTSPSATIPNILYVHPRILVPAIFWVTYSAAAHSHMPWTIGSSSPASFAPLREV